MSDEHDHCDRDPVECSYQVLVGEYDEAVRQRDELKDRWIDANAARAAADAEAIRLQGVEAERDRLRAVLDGLARFLEVEPGDEVAPGDLKRLVLRISTLAADREYLDEQSVGLVAELDRLRAALGAIANTPSDGTMLISSPTVADLQAVARNALAALDASEEGP